MARARLETIDGNEAAASVAYRVNEVAAIYPITPSSSMGELFDEWSARGRENVWGAVPQVTEMQSEAGAAGAIHGALQGGALATTFTASQGLLLMIPDMFKIAGELTPFVMHVAARAIATHALSIFGDHSDVMAVRQTGFALLSSGNVQEAHDLACIAQMATLEARVPFLHFFDGFRTSHEVSKIAMLEDDDLRALVDDAPIDAHRARALRPEHPVLRGTAQNPDTFFQAREGCNGYYDACPGVVERAMERFAERTGRAYRPFDYHGHPEAERVVVLMGSGADTARIAVDHLVKAGERVGVLAVRLYRPFSTAHMLAALPASVRGLAVLDRTKEPGAPGEPLYLDVCAALRTVEQEGASPFATPPRVVGGRYGLSSKEFTPAMVKAALDELGREAPRNPFTLGIVDDVTHLSLEHDLDWNPADPEVVRAVFFGLGADGTVGANKNSIKIIGSETDFHAQGYFVYDSKKSGAVTISHLRFGPRPIRSHYLITEAQFVACHQFQFLERYEVVELAAHGATLLLNSPWSADEVWDHLPREVQEQILAKQLSVHVIDATRVAEAAGMGRRINTVMQTAFFALSGVLPRETAIEKIRGAIEKTYASKGAEVVKRNIAAVESTLAHLYQVELPAAVTAERGRPPMVPDAAPDFVQRVTSVVLAGKGDLLPVSAFPPDGTWPVGTARWERRGVAERVPLWDASICIQCNKCALICPHAAIRAKAYDPGALSGAPEGFLSNDYRGKELPGKSYTIQVAPDDCTGCNLCVTVCPAKDKAAPKRKAINMEALAPVRERERERYEFFLGLPQVERQDLTRIDVKTSQLLLPLFEYSGACAGCGETPYVKLVTQLFGDRALVANATGCSSIYGGNLPTTPWTTDAHGRGPAWSNSLFEDNAEFGLGFRLALDSLGDHARGLLGRLGGVVGDELTQALLGAEQRSDEGVRAQRERVAELRRRLEGSDDPDARRLHRIAEVLERKSVWLMGGDGWAYDIGYGGLDHVLSLGRDINALVLDTEVYSNTGGQASKATPLGAVAKFAARGKAIGKKDLGLMAMSYGHIYVASIAMGAKDQHTLKAFQEAEAYDGPSLLIAYSHCIAHGYDMAYGADQQKRAVDSGIWPLYRYDPRRLAAGEPPLEIDAPGDKIPVQEYMRNETRFRAVERIDPEGFRRYARESQLNAERRVALYRHMAGLRYPAGPPPAAPSAESEKPAPVGSSK